MFRFELILWLSLNFWLIAYLFHNVKYSCSVIIIIFFFTLFRELVVTSKMNFLSVAFRLDYLSRGSISPRMGVLRGIEESLMVKLNKTQLYLSKILDRVLSWVLIFKTLFKTFDM